MINYSQSKKRRNVGETSEGSDGSVDSTFSGKRVRENVYNNFCWRFTGSKVPGFQHLFDKLSEFPHIDRFRFQLEKGEGGVEHWQGCMTFTSKKRRAPVRELFSDYNLQFPNIDYLEPCIKAKAQEQYCMKEDTRIDGPWQWGEFPEEPEPLRLKEPSKAWMKEILDIIKETPDDRTIHWYWSNSGGVGKTTFCKYLVHHHKAIILHGKGSDIRNGITTYLQKYKVTPKLILYTIPKSFNKDYLSYEGLENIKDMLFYSGKYEGSMVCGNSPHLLVFANTTPNEAMCAADRWVVREITDDPF